MYLSVNTIAGVASPGSGAMHVALIAPKTSSGDLTVDTEVRAGGGGDSAATAFGNGGIGHLAAKTIYDLDPTAQIDFIAPTAGSTAATLNLTFANSPSSNTVVLLDIHGVEFEVPWLSGEDSDDIRDSVISAVNSRTSQLMVTASSGGTGIVTLTFKVTGNIGNDTRVYASLSTQTSSETINGATSVSTTLAGGTTDPDLTTALASLEGKEYHIILPILSNTDVANVSTANNLSKVVTHVSSMNIGRDAKLQQVVAGYTGGVSAAIATTSNANSFGNADFGELIHCLNSRDLPGIVAAREVADWLIRYSIDPAANRIGRVLSGLSGAKDKISDKPTDTEVENLLGNGVSVISYTPQGQPFLVRAVTTHSQDTSGNPDRRLLDVQNVVAEYSVSRDFRDTLPLAFPEAKITRDTLPGEDPPPAGVLEERDVKAWVVERLIEWAHRAVINRAMIKTVVDDGSLIVQVDETDPTQLNLVIPKKILQPWAKTSLVSQRMPG
jgi:phage tail sheath gpL-like